MGEPVTPIRVTYTIEPTDRMVLFSHSVKEAKNLAPFRKTNYAAACATILLFIIFAALFQLLGFRWYNIWSFLLGGYLSLIALVVALLLTKAKRMKALSPQSCYPSVNFSCELSEEGISIKTPVSGCFYGWQCVTRYLDISEYLVLFSGPGDIAILPRRAFASDADFNAAVTFAKERVHGQTL